MGYKGATKEKRRERGDRDDLAGNEEEDEDGSGRGQPKTRGKERKERLTESEGGTMGAGGSPQSYGNVRHWTTRQCEIGPRCKLAQDGDTGTRKDDLPTDH